MATREEFNISEAEEERLFDALLTMDTMWGLTVTGIRMRCVDVPLDDGRVARVMADGVVHVPRKEKEETDGSSP